MRRLDASSGKNAGIDPSVRTRRHPSRVFEQGGGPGRGPPPDFERRVLAGFRLQGLCSSPMKRLPLDISPRTAVRRVDGVCDDLRARREGRHQDLFGSPAAGWTTGRAASPRRPIPRRRPRRVESSVPLEQQLLGQVDDFRYSSCANYAEDRTKASRIRSGVSVGVSLQPLLRPGDSRGAAPRREHRSATERRRRSLMPPPVDRGRTQRFCHGEGSVRPHAVQRELDVQLCFRPSLEHAGKGAAPSQTSTARLIPPSLCTAGGLHGG